MSVYGTDNLSDLLVFLGKLASTAKQAVDNDGKISFKDAALFVELLFPAIAAITAIDQVPAELEDLDPSEQEAVMASFKNSLDLHENDELTAQAGLQVIFDLVEFLRIVGVFKSSEQA